MNQTMKQSGRKKRIKQIEPCPKKRDRIKKTEQPCLQGGLTSIRHRMAGGADGPRNRLMLKILWPLECFILAFVMYVYQDNVLSIEKTTSKLRTRVPRVAILRFWH